MLSVNEYIDLILKKKKWTRTKLLEELNKLEKKMGDTKTRIPNISNHLNGSTAFSVITLAKWEWALDLPKGTLVKMVQQPITQAGKDELKRMYEMIDKYGREVR